MELVETSLKKKKSGEELKNERKDAGKKSTESNSGNMAGLGSTKSH